MAKIQLGYGHRQFALDLPDKQIQEIISANIVNLPKMSSEDAVKGALSAPVDSPKLTELVSKGEKICLIAPDITRVWQSPSITIPLVVAELNSAGIPDSDITILFANGTHRRMTDAEHEKVVGSDIIKRIRVVDHQCKNREDLRHMGETSRGTPVWFNRHAVKADKIVTVSGAVFHFLAGYGGGGKMLLPGIAGDETIQANHKLALNKGVGSGRNPNARSGNLTPTNPVHADIFEAAALLPPIFSVNVVTNDKAEIIKAFAGNWIKSHAQACKLVARLEGVPMRKPANFVIASSGGSPKDINLYQGIKTLSNALDAATPGAVVITLLQCPEGFGNADCQRLICDFDNMKDREKSLRQVFSIGAFVGYFLAQAAEKYKMILVTDMDAKNFAKTRIKVAADLPQAIQIAKELLDRPDEPCVIMPHASATMPLIAL